MPPTSQSEITILLFPFKLRDSAASVFVTKQHGRACTWSKLEEKALMNAVGNPLIFWGDFKIPG